MQNQSRMKSVASFQKLLLRLKGKSPFLALSARKYANQRGGLTKHVNSKHRDVATSIASPALTMDNLKGIIEEIKTKLVNDDLYGPDVNAAIESISCSKALFDAILPIYNKFCRKKNQDALEEFYGLLPINASVFLNCPDNNVGNLIMIEIPDRLVGFCKLSVGQADEQNKP